MSSHRPCPKCGAEYKQEFKWKPDNDPKQWRQRCHVYHQITKNGETYWDHCGYDSGWQPWPPPVYDPGYTYKQLVKMQPARVKVLNEAREKLVLARRLSLAWPTFRERIDDVIAEVDECLSRLEA